MTAVFSRRGALGAGAVALGAGLAIGARPAVADSGTGSLPASAAHADDTGAGATAAAAFDPTMPVRSLFAGHEGREYLGFSPWSQHALVLDRVEALPGEGDTEHRFRVEFSTDAGARDGLYRLQHGGELVAVLFLVRVGPDARLEGIVDRREAS